MSGHGPELEPLRAREHEIGQRIAQAARDLRVLDEEIAHLRTRLPELREAVEKQRAARDQNAPPTPLKIFLSVLLAPVGLLLGALSGAFAATFVALPAFALGIRSDLGLPLLFVMMAGFALLGLGCLLLALWEE